MSKADDINTLFRRFGGNADTYKEIVAAEHVGSARQKWPLLGQIRPQVHNEPPGAVKDSPRSGGSPVREIQPLSVPHTDVRAYAQTGSSTGLSAGRVVLKESESLAAPVADDWAPADMACAHDAALLAREGRDGVVATESWVGQRAAVRREAVSDAPLVAEETDLQQLFRRMLAAAEEPAPSSLAAPSVHPLKRLAKW